MDFNIDLNSMNQNLIINANDNDDNDLSIDSSEARALNNNQKTPSTDPQNLLKLSFNEESNLTFLSDIQKSFTYFMLQLREKFCLPKTTINSISNYIVTLINNIESLLEQQAIGYDPSNTTKLSSSKTTSEVNKDVIELRLVRNTMKEVCHAIEAVTHNEYQFLKYCEKYFKYNSPQEVIVSAPGEKLQYSYFVPIDQTLISILHNRETVDQILNNIKQQQEAVFKDEDIMFSFRDSNYGFRTDDDSMLIQLYADEIGLTNPIGAKKDKHKMFMIYFSLEDIPDEHKSKLDQIHLVALCESIIIKDRAKAKRFFEPIINNLNQLQIEGLVVNDHRIKFSFSTLVADNLAAHQIGGFQSNFSNGHFCRRCFITYPERNLPMSAMNIAIRTSIIHDDLVQQISTNPSNSPLMGVVGQSVLHNLLGYHPISSLPADLMHDYLEGLCPIVIISLLKEASSMHLLTYEHEIDGETLFMMDSIEKLTLFPKLKQKLLFLREREKLFRINDDSSITITDSSSSSTLNSRVSSSYFESQINFLTDNSMNDQILEKSSTKSEINLTFPDQYVIPTLPNALLEDIEADAIHKFAPHHANRQVLIDTIAHDLINNFNI
ncbi:unnamed protein product, partial [Rotaria sordida]